MVERLNGMHGVESTQLNRANGNNSQAREQTQDLIFNYGDGAGDSTMGLTLEKGAKNKDQNLTYDTKNGVHFTSNAGNASSASGAGTSNVSKPKTAPKGEPITNADIDMAQTAGRRVYERLAGYTTSKEGREASAMISQLRTKDVFPFLRGYESEAKASLLPRDSFFTQLATEQGMSNKKELLKGVAVKLQDRMTELGMSNSDLRDLVNHVTRDGGEFTPAIAAKMDAAVQRLLKSDIDTGL